MGSINYGTQTVSIQFFAPADAKVVNKRHLGITQRGIYAGGYLTKVSDSLVSISPLICEIGETDHQVRVQTEVDATISVNSSTPFIVLRWSYAESNVNYMDMLALASGSILANDIIVGKCVYAGATLSSFDYTLRSNPNVLNFFLNVEPTTPASMRVRIRSGRVNYGSVNFDVIDQLSPVFTAPLSNSRIDVLYIDTDGAIKTFNGVVSASPVPPNYNSKKVLAEITLTTGQTEITSTSIKDVRSWI